jgi:hypothetical protein
MRVLMGLTIAVTVLMLAQLTMPTPAEANHVRHCTVGQAWQPWPQYRRYRHVRFGQLGHFSHQSQRCD